MMKSSTKGLFGGALLSAGLVTGVAQAQQFVIAYSSATAYAYTFAGGFNSNNWNSNGPFSISAASSNDYGDYASGSVTVQPTFMSLTGTAISNYSYCFGHGEDFISYFGVDQNLAASISWNWNSSGFGGSAFVYDLTASQTVFQDSGFGSGTQQFNLDASHQYYFQGFTDAGANPGEQFNVFTEVTIVPGPGSAALLSVAGLAAVRRRRRNC